MRQTASQAPSVGPLVTDPRRSVFSRLSSDFIISVNTFERIFCLCDKVLPAVDAEEFAGKLARPMSGHRSRFTIKTAT